MLISRRNDAHFVTASGFLTNALFRQIVWSNDTDRSLINFAISKECNVSITRTVVGITKLYANTIGRVSILKSVKVNKEMHQHP